MKLSVRQTDVSPRENVFQGGYVQRKTRMEGLHDPIMCTAFVLRIKEETLIWCTADIVGTSQQMYDAVLNKLADKGVITDEAHYVLCGTHTHSGPNVTRMPFGDNFEEPEQKYFEYLTDCMADTIAEAVSDEGVTVKTCYSEVLIDGLYSNRNDKNKLSDKHEYMIGFFDENDKPVGIYHLMSHHCTVLGPQNMLCSADLYGSLRVKLQEYFSCPVFMAQGNAGDMGNKQYRDGNDFAALERQSTNLFQQIVNKYSWKELNMEGYDFREVCYHAHFHVDYSEYKDKYTEFSERLEKATNVDEIKLLTGWVGMAKMKMDLPAQNKDIDMKAGILTMGDLQIVLCPGELGSILGLRIKEASKAQLCFVWGYNRACNLGYMIEKEAFETESQESQVTEYIPGIADEYVNEIIRNL